MLTRATRWFLIAAPLLAGILLMIFGTAGAISQAFGITLIGIAVMVWMWNWFVRMSFAEDTREREAQAREEPVRRVRVPPEEPEEPEGPHVPPERSEHVPDRSEHVQRRPTTRRPSPGTTRRPRRPQ